MSKSLILLVFASLLSACSATPVSPAPINETQNPSLSPSPTATPSPTIASKTTSELLNLKPNPKMHATFKTSQGSIKVELFFDKAPNTVANFVALSEGTKDWVDPQTGKTVSGKPLYNGTIFHRVIKDFMVQGGDPLGNGTGGPGYKFADEFDPSLTFEKPFMLAMANSGVNTNGSQFFITTVPTTWLNGKHTIFGKVIEGMDIVTAISNTPTNQSDQPVKQITLNSVTIERQ